VINWSLSSKIKLNFKKRLGGNKNWKKIKKVYTPGVCTIKVFTAVINTSRHWAFEVATAVD